MNVLEVDILFTKEGNYHIPEVYDMFNSDVTKLTIFIKKLPLQGKKLGNETKILGNDSENLGNNISTTNIIDNLKFKEDVKSNLKTLHNYFKDEVFRNVNNQE